MTSCSGLSQHDKQYMLKLGGRSRSCFGRCKVAYNLRESGKEKRILKANNLICEIEFRARMIVSLGWNEEAAISGVIGNPNNTLQDSRITEGFVNDSSISKCWRERRKRDHYPRANINKDFHFLQSQQSFVTFSQYAR